jgi:hypothetical protein
LLEKEGRVIWLCLFYATFQTVILISRNLNTPLFVGAIRNKSCLLL